MASNSNAERQEHLQSFFDSDEPLMVHRFEIPNEIARTVIATAKEDERTIPAQIRMALKFWSNSLSKGTAHQ